MVSCSILTGRRVASSPANRYIDQQQVQRLTSRNQFSGTKCLFAKIKGAEGFLRHDINPLMYTDLTSR